MTLQETFRAMIVGLVLVGAALPLGAAVLIFDQSQTVLDGQAVHEGYGDNIAAVEFGAFRYRMTDGRTTHVSTAYGPDGSMPALWTTGYGDLSNVLYQADESTTTLEVTFTGESGWSAVLHGFDLAVYAADFGSFPVTIDAVQVFDSRGTVVFESLYQEVSESTQTTIEFDPPLEGVELTLRLDLSSLASTAGASRGGNAIDGVGIDNLRFGERGPIPFRGGTIIAETVGSSRVLLVDLDGDADVDLLEASYGQGVNWWLDDAADDNPENTFDLMRVIDDETGVTGIAAADLDNDGDLDVVASWDSGNKVTWYENLGDGFGDPLTNERVIASVSDYSFVAVADLDDDGDLDVLSTSDQGGSVFWHENDGTPGDGGWTDHTISAFAGGALHVSTSDLDRDGDLDVLVASELAPVFSWYENLGGGDFGDPLINQRVIATTAQGGRSLIAADFDKDGAPDLVAASCDDDTIAWYPNELNTITEDFGAAETLSTTAACPVSLVTADLDRDGDSDILAASFDGSALWFRNVGNRGEFTAGTDLPGMFLGADDVQTADIDRDDDLDVVVAFGGEGEVAIFENRTIHRDAALLETGIHHLIDVGDATELVTADIDRDGDADAISARFAGATFEIRLHRNDGRGNFSSSTIANFAYVEDLRASDIDGDGDDDLLVVGQGHVSWLENTDGAGSWAMTPAVISSGSGSTVYRSTRTADLDKDGDLDVAVGGHDGSTGIVAWFENDGTPGDGGWVEHGMSLPAGTERVFAIAVGDLDQDGSLDVVSTTGRDIYAPSGACRTCSIVWFAGDAGQQPAQFVRQTPIPTAMALGPVEIVPGSKPASYQFRTLVDPDLPLPQDDADPDLWTGSDNLIEFRENRLNEPSADFSPPENYYLPLDSADPYFVVPALAVEDFMLSGRSDLVFAVDGLDLGFGYAGYGVLKHDGLDGIYTGLLPRAVATADADGDGDPDLLVAQSYAEPERGASFESPGVYFSPNYIYQFNAVAESYGDTANDGKLKRLFTHEISILAIPGDPSARVETIDLRFTDATAGPEPGNPLTSAQANALIENLFVFRNARDCSPNCPEVSSDDVLVATISDLDLDAQGRLTIVLPGNDPNTLVAAPARFSIVAEIADQASYQAIHNFIVEHPGGGVFVRDSLIGSPLNGKGGQPEVGPPIFISADVDSFADIADANPGDRICDDGAGNCTLRAAVQEANLRDAPDLIVLDAGTYTLTVPGNGEDAAETGDLDITRANLVIRGAGRDKTIIDGASLDRIFDVHTNATLELIDLTITNGSVSGPVPDGLGGAIRVRTGTSVLNVRNCAITDSSATAGGGVGVGAAGDDSNLDTGIDDSVISGNTATELGGGVYALVGLTKIKGSTITGNSASRHGGVSIGWHATVTIELSTVSVNAATGGEDGSPTPPEPCGCCQDNSPEAGCDDAVCANMICGTFPECCTEVWADWCADFAVSYCDCCNPPAPPPDPGGVGGGIGTRGILSVWDSTVSGNMAAVGGGGVFNVNDRSAWFTNSIVAGNLAPTDPDCSGSGRYRGRFSLFQDSGGCAELADETGMLLGVDPLLGPLQNNGGTTLTHALLAGSPAIDSGECIDGPGLVNVKELADQRGFHRIDLLNLVNPPDGDGCDIGAFEFQFADAVPLIEVPVRWCVVEGSASFDFDSPTVQGDVNAALVSRHEMASDNVYKLSANVRFRSAANANIPDFPILPDPNTEVGVEGDVAIDTSIGEYSEFMKLVADCREAWEALDPQIVGITAVNINRFVDPNGIPVDIEGVGGRAEFGDVAGQMEAGRVMVVDRVYRNAPWANPDDEIDRLLAHELGHAAGALRHGDGLDNVGIFPQCENATIDDNDDQCEAFPRFDGQNLMQYRRGTELTIEQIQAIRAHILLTIPDVHAEVTNTAEADATAIEADDFVVLEYEFLNVIDFERFNVFDFERFNVFDFERFNVFDFERFNVFDFEFLNVFEFGMEFTEDDPVNGPGEVTVFASLGGLPWPTPVRPPTTYFWYLDLDEDPAFPGSGDATGSVPGDHGFAGSDSGESGVDVIVQLDLYSHCDQLSFVCDDFALKTAFVWDVDAVAYVVAYGPVSAEDDVQPVTLGLDQSSPNPDAQDPLAGFVLAPSIPLSVLVNAGVGYQPGDPVAIEVVTALPCELTLPDGTAVSCQCTDCVECPDYPGCDNGMGVPDLQLLCSDGTTPCMTDEQCATGDVCGGGKSCSVGGSSCVSNADCTVGDTDACGGAAAFLSVDSPAAAVEFEPAVFPSCVIQPSVVTAGNDVTVAASDFPADPRPVRVKLAGEEIGGGVLDPVTGEAILVAGIPYDAPGGPTDLTVIVDGLATTATCSVNVVAPNRPPVANCPNRTVGADELCQGSANVAGLSYDPDGDPIVVEQDVTGPYPLGETLVSLTVTDDHDQWDSCISTVTVVDTTPPQIMMNDGDLILRYESVFTELGAAAVDNCDTVDVVIGGDTVDTTVPGTYVITYSALDSSGNPAQATRTVIVEPPNVAPVAVCAEVTVATDDSCQAWASVADASYDPNGDPLVVVQDPSGPFALGQVLVTATVSDDEGLSDSCTGAVTVVDLTPPQVTLTGEDGGGDGGCPTPCDCCSRVGQETPGCPSCLPCQDVVCGVDPFCCDVMWDDACDDHALLLCTCCPGDGALSLLCDVDQFDDPGATAVDNCDTVDTVVVDDTVDTGVAGTYVVTYTAVDSAGNVGQAERIVTVEPMSGLNEAGAPDATIECDESMDPQHTGSAVVSETCQAASGTNQALDNPDQFSGSETVIDFEDLAEGVLVTDQYASQGVTISPEASIATWVDPWPRLYGPPGDMALNNFNTALDLEMLFASPINRVGFEIRNNDGDDLTVTVKSMSNGQVIDSRFFVTNIDFRFVGLESALEFDQVIVDVSGPEGGIFGLDNLRFESVGAPAVDVSYSDSVAEGACPQESIFTRTWTATDSTGSAETHAQTITVVDTTGPTLDCPADVTLECPGDTSIALNGMAGGSDSCDPNPQIDSTDSSVPGPPGTYTLTRTWTGTDACSQTNSCDQVISVMDTTAPTVILIGEPVMTLECGLGSWVEPGATVTDACDTSVSVVYGGSVDPSMVAATTLTYDATDASGIVAEQVTRTVMVQDSIPPVIVECAEDVELYVDAATGTVPAPDLVPEMTATDACGVAITQDIVAGSPIGAGDTTVTFTVADSLHETTCTSNIRVLDRLISSDEKIKVRFDDEEDSDIENPEEPDPGCFDRLDADGGLQLRDASMLPVDVRQPGAETVGARLVLSLGGFQVADEQLILDVKDHHDERWEYKRPGNLPKEGIKKLKIDWHDVAEYDSHDGTGLDGSVPRIETRFIGYDETDLKLKFNELPRPFTVAFDDPDYGVLSITIHDIEGSFSVEPAGVYENRPSGNSLSITVPFRLTPETAISWTADGGLTSEEIPVDVEINFSVAGAKYTLDFDRSVLTDAFCGDDPAFDAASPTLLEMELHLGSGLSEVVANLVVGSDPLDWTEITIEQWRQVAGGDDEGTD